MKVVIKKLFSIDVILLFIAIFTLTATELFKVLTFKEFASLEYTIQAFVSGDDREVLSKLEKQLEPYLYFNNELSVFIASSGKITNPIDFLGEIHLIQRRIAIGFDNLFLFCALLFSISIAILTSLFLKEKAEQEQRQSLNEAQSQFRRDLHDSVAQDLLAAKIYLQKDDREKVSYFLDYALKETRYLIDTLPPPQPYNLNHR